MLPSLKKICKVKVPLDQNSKQCLICYENLTGKDSRGLLPCLHHQFCYACAIHWAEVTNKCPVCLKRFNFIQSALPKGRGMIKGDILFIPDRDPDNTQDPEFLEFYMSIRCQICGRQNNEERLLLCDECDEAFHLECLGMSGIPHVDQWYCDVCLGYKHPEVIRTQWEEMGNVGRKSCSRHRLKRLT